MADDAAPAASAAAAGAAGAPAPADAGLPPLSAAAAAGQVAVLRDLLEAKADPNSFVGGSSALQNACTSDQSAAAAALLDARADPDGALAGNGTTPLMLAAQRGHAKVVELLLARGAAVRGRNHHGATALHTASEVGFPPVVAALLAAGADPMAGTTTGVTPLGLAVHAKNAEVERALREAAAANRSLRGRVAAILRRGSGNAAAAASSAKDLRDLLAEAAGGAPASEVAESNASARLLLSPFPEEGAPTLLHAVLQHWTGPQLRAAGPRLAAAVQWACGPAVAPDPAARPRVFAAAARRLRDNPLLHTAAAAVDARCLGAMTFLCAPAAQGGGGGAIDATADCEYGGSSIFAAIRNVRLGDGRHGADDNAETARSDAACVRAMVDDLGASLEVADDKGATPLMIAAVCNAVEVARLLVTGDPAANTGALDKRGQQAIHLAKSDGMKAVLADAMARQGVEAAEPPAVQDGPGQCQTQ